MLAGTDGGFAWAGWLAMTALILAFWALLLVAGLAIVNSIRSDDRSDRHHLGRSDAQRLLDERFAHGELDEADYNQRRELLRATH
jgi:putative membrane protein